MKKEITVMVDEIVLDDIKAKLDIMLIKIDKMLENAKKELAKR